MQIKRNCKVCGKKFIAIKKTQLYDNRRCFKRAYYLRTKARLQQRALLFPTKTCGFCNVVQYLKFDPIKVPYLFDSLECLNCGVSNNMIWKYQDRENSREIIQSIITSTKTYHPAPRIEPESKNVSYYPLIQTGGSALTIV